jgi:beta-glucosidase
LADVLFGEVNPSARLHVTIPNKDNEVSFTKAQYPGLGFPPEAEYSEKLLIGYRYYDAYHVTPLYPFGYGLSYTTFLYSNLNVQRVSSDDGNALFNIAVDITNSGDLFGYEIPQLYVSFPSAAAEPPQQLKGFTKVELDTKETKTVAFTITKRDLSIWDSNVHDWSLVTGTFEFRVGASSRDIYLVGTGVV